MTKTQPSKWDWQSSILLIFLILSVAVRLEQTRWAEDLGYVESIAIAGAALGLLLGVSRFSSRQAALLGFLYTVLYLPLAASNILNYETTGLAKLVSLGARLQIAVGQVAAAQPVTDAIFFVTQMAVLLWLVGLTSGYQLLRSRNVNKVLIAPTLVILIVQYFDGLVTDRIWNLAIYFFLALVLVGRINLLRSRDRWLQEGVIVGTQPEYDLNRFMVLFSVVIILFSWLLPYPSEFQPLLNRGINTVKEGSNAIQSRFEDFFAALTPSIKLVTPNRFPEKYGLGENAEISDEPIYRVSLAGKPNPKYWPVRVYDRYQGYQWQGVIGQDAPFDPGQGVLTPQHFSNSTEREVTIRWISQPVDLLVKPLNTFWVSRSVNVKTEKLQELIEPVLMNATPDVQNGDTYSARYYEENLTQQELKEAGVLYPQGLLEKYLDLGTNPSESIAELARQVTAGAETEYEKAALVTSYLRENYKYVDSVGPLPSGVDPVEWFLFDGKKGYCNYYASAEVLMLRSLGIPTRLVVGYTGGQMDEDDWLIFQQKNSHAWPEVYFPDIGWVEFEPTASVDAVIWPIGETTQTLALPITGSEFADRDRNPQLDVEGDGLSGQEQVSSGFFLSPTIIAWALGLGVLVLVVALLFIRRQHLNLYFAQLPLRVQHSYSERGRQIPNWVNLWARWVAAERIERQFSVVNLSLWLLDVRVNLNQTPSERARLLSQELPEASADVTDLYQELEGCLFSQNYNTDPNKSLLMAVRIVLKVIQKKLSILAYGR